MTDTTTGAVERWSVVRNNSGLGYFDGIEPDSNGGFVTYDEYHALAAERDALRAAIKRQAGAAKTLRQLTLDEVQHLKDADRTNHIAPSVIQGEREANAILSADNEALRTQLVGAQAQVQTARDALDECVPVLCAVAMGDTGYTIGWAKEVGVKARSALALIQPTTDRRDAAKSIRAIGMGVE